MIYDWKLDPNDLTKAHPGYGRLFDANGQEVLEKVFWTDTETGEMRYYLPDLDGTGACGHALDEKGENFLEGRDFRPTPLLMVFNLPHE